MMRPSTRAAAPLAAALSCCLGLLATGCPDDRGGAPPQTAATPTPAAPAPAAPAPAEPAADRRAFEDPARLIGPSAPEAAPPARPAADEARPAEETDQKTLDAAELLGKMPTPKIDDVDLNVGTASSKNPTDPRAKAGEKAKPGARPSAPPRAPAAKPPAARPGPARPGVKKRPRNLPQGAIVDLIARGQKVDLKDHLEQGVINIVEFYMDRSPECQEHCPRVETLVREHGGARLLRVDVLKLSSPVAKQYNIGSVPAWAVYDGEKLIGGGLKAVEQVLSE